MPRPVDRGKFPVESSRPRAPVQGSVRAVVPICRFMLRCCKEQPVKEKTIAYVGVDWARAVHQACVIDSAGNELGNRQFEHSGSGLDRMADWIVALGDAGPGEIAVGIETPHGPVVEALQGRGLRVYSINPKQLDRFRDRYFPAGQKDDRRDARVLADSLRTDPGAYRRLLIPEESVLELRECSRDANDLVAERTRLAHRIRQQLWRYYPQLLQLGDVTEDWLLTLWEAAPTPEQARRLRRSRIRKILARGRIRRIGVEDVRQVLHQKPLQVIPGTRKAAASSIALSIQRLRLVQSQLGDVERRMADLIEAVDATDGEGDLRSGQRDSDILRSFPGVGTRVLATLLAEAYDPLKRRDYRSLRALSGVAPVTQRSGASLIVKRRRAANKLLRNAVWHWSRVAIQHDPPSRRKYDLLRSRGHRHARALRGVADRLLYVACTALREGTLYNPDQPVRERAA